MKSVWITGASSGIGESVAILLESDGWEVIVSARNTDKLQGMASQYANIHALPADITRKEDMAHVAEYFTSRNKPLDVVIVNAGVCEYMQDAAFSYETFKYVLDANVLAAAATIDVAMPWLKQSALRGHIVGISSMSVYLPFTRAEYYGASKSALTYYLQSLAMDVHDKNVDVSVVFPGFIDTPLTQKNDFPMPFLQTSGQAAMAIRKVMQARPATAAFPKRLHYLLRLLRRFPCVWRLMRKKARQK
jgi:short-subunit dehydrogenase